MRPRVGDRLNNDINVEKHMRRPEILSPAGNFEKLKMAAVLQFTLPGVPCIYYTFNIQFNKNLLRRLHFRETLKKITKRNEKFVLFY